MQPNIHPSDYKEVQVACRCGETYHMFMCLTQDHLSLDVCGKCHPAYTKKMQNIINSGNKRVEAFYKKYAKNKKGREATK